MADSSAHSWFDLAESLPSGTRLAVEASAGTGKTYTLAALAAREVALGRATASQLLIVTFTRAAAAELRGRVRQRLESCAAALSDPAMARTSDDDLIAFLADGTDAEVARRRRRLDVAVTEFDTALVTTIHGFALQALAAAGVAAGGDLDARLVDDTSQLVPSVASDVLVTEAARGRFDSFTTASKFPTIGTLEGNVGVALALPNLTVLPEPGTPVGKPTPFWAEDLAMAEMTRTAVNEVHRRRRRAATLAYDDLLPRMLAAATGPTGAAVVSQLRARFRVVMVDEFQDTDEVQWEVLSALFGTGPAAPELFAVVGDPKQAIYSFRGADVRTYLDAVQPANGFEQRQLARNWRSDERALDAVDTLFTGSSFGDQRIGFPRVASSDPMIGRHLTINGEVRSGLDLRVVRADPDQPALKAPDGRAAAMADLAAVLSDLFESGEIPDGDQYRRVCAQDVAVLVRTAEEARQALGALRRAEIPAVLARSGSVLDSRAAEQWRWLLDALVRPADLRRARLAAVSWFGGRTAAAVHAAGDDGLEGLQTMLVELDETLTTQGAAAFVREVLTRTNVTSNVLQRPDGDRSLTDLEHVGELLSSASGPVTAGTLLNLLDRGDPDPQKSEADDHEIDREARRVESDESAVQIMTVWVAKGLEFPIVACPTLWAYGLSGKVHRDDHHGRTLAIMNRDDKNDEGLKRAVARRRDVELLGDRLRLLYVALTRAAHHTMLWWVPSESAKCQKTALARVLFARDGEGSYVPDAFDLGALAEGSTPFEVAHSGEGDDDVVARLERVANRSDGTVFVTEVPRGRPTARAPTADGGDDGDPAELVANTLDRPLDRRAMRWSFSAIKSREKADDDPLDTTGADAGADDEQLPPDVEEVPEVAPAVTGGGAESPMAGLPGGTTFGNLLHDVLEHADFATEDLRAEFEAVVAGKQLRRRVRLVPQDTDSGTEAQGTERLLDGLVAMARTPLGATLDSRDLSTFARGDRLDELEFDLHLAGSADVTLARVGQILVEHLDPDDRYLEWARRLAGGDLDVDLRGHLTGSIDAVLRVGEPGRHRFVVVDYKSNRLHTRGSPPEPGDYGRDAMDAQMVQSHYTLQALLYMVALHRYLRWRLPGYHPASHLGGSAYLFAKGMAGPDTRTVDGTVEGVSEWHPGAAVVGAVSDALDGRFATAASAGSGGTR